MVHLSLPFITIGIATLFVGAVIVLRAGIPRHAAVVTSIIACLSFLLAAREVVASGHARQLFDPLIGRFEADALDAVPMAFFAVLTLLVIILAPKRDATGRDLAGMLLISAATQISYAAADLITLAVGWGLTSLPFMLHMFDADRSRKIAQGFLLASSLALVAAIIALHAARMEDLSHTSMLAFGLLILAVILRKGVFPLHSWMVHVFEHGPLLPAVLIFNGHLGALLIARSEATALPQTALHALNVLGIAALATALITSIRSFAERKPRRLLALLCVSQASFILAGIATSTAEGITGALIHWLVVSTASTGLVCIVRVLEVRVAGVVDLENHFGFAVKAPRLATFFLLCGLALIGLPGTLGYCAEDLIFHGALENHPWLGIALPIATAFNAINLMRLFSIIFLGVLPKDVIDIPDALPRERWPLAACMIFLIAGGILPGVVIGWRADAAHAIEAALGIGH